MSIRLTVMLLFIVYGGGLSVLAQDTESFAERYLEQGIRFLEENNKDAGFQDLRTVVSSFPSSEEAPEALWQMAIFLASPGVQDERIKLLNELISKYPASIQAAAANVELGTILVTTGDRKDREKARANFARVISVFPGTPAADNAHIGMAHLLVLEKRYRDAEVELTKVLIRQGEGDSGRRALENFAVVYVLQNQPIKAMSALQKLILMENSDTVREKLNADLTVLKRLYLASDRPLLREKTFTLINSAIKKPVDLCFDAHNRLLVLDDRGSVFSIHPADSFDRHILTSNGSLEHIQKGINGDVLYYSEEQIWLGDNLIRPVATAPFKKIQSVAWCSPGEFWVLDKSQKGVIRLDRSGNFIGRKPEINADGDEIICPVPTGGTWILSPDLKAVFLFNHDGELTGRLEPAGAGYTLEAPVDVAADQFGQMYLLDRKLNRILVFNSNLLKVADFSLSPYGISSPVQMTVGRDGSLYVSDKKRNDVVKLY